MFSTSEGNIMLYVGLIVGFAIGYLFYGFLKDRVSFKSSNTKKDKVLEYLHDHGSINAKQGKDIGVNHLRSVICKMKKDGKSIININPVGQKAKYKFK